MVPFDFWIKRTLQQQKKSSFPVFIWKIYTLWRPLWVDLSVLNVDDRGVDLTISGWLKHNGSHKSDLCFFFFLLCNFLFKIKLCTSGRPLVTSALSPRFQNDTAAWTWRFAVVTSSTPRQRGLVAGDQLICELTQTMPVTSPLFRTAAAYSQNRIDYLWDSTGVESMLNSERSSNGNNSLLFVRAANKGKSSRPRHGGVRTGLENPARTPSHNLQPARSELQRQVTSAINISTSA